MTQRNPQNARYREGGKKGTTRKSSSSAKPKSSAGSTVYVRDKGAKSKVDQKVAKEKERSARQAAEEQRVISKGDSKARKYKMWKRIWIALIVIAIVAVALYACAAYLMVEGRALEAFIPYRAQLMLPSIIVGYIGIIGALAVDCIQIRPIRKAADTRRRPESRKAQKHREAVEADNRSKSRLLKFWNRDK